MGVKWNKENLSKMAEYNKKWKKDNPEKAKDSANDWYERNKDHRRIRHCEISKEVSKRLFNRVLDYYGHFCYMCNSSEKLCVDHIGGDRRNGPTKSGAPLWRWLIKNNFPPGFRILCHPCNLLDGLLRKHKLFGLDGIDALHKLVRK